MNSWIEIGYLKLASKKIVAASGVIFILSQVAIGYLLHHVGPADALRLQLTFSSQAFSEILTKWGDTGVAAYITHFYLDYFHALIYAVFLSSAVAFLTHRPDRKPGSISLGVFILPWIAAICDMAENTIHLYLIRHPNTIEGKLVIFSGICTWTKWSLAAISVVVILSMLFRKGWSHEIGVIQDSR